MEAVISLPTLPQVDQRCQEALPGRNPAENHQRSCLARSYGAQ